MATAPSATPLEIRRARLEDDPDALGAFFAATVHPAYISHGEVMGGSAPDFDRWRDDLPAFAADGIRKTLTEDPHGERERVYLALEGGKVVGLALVSFQRSALAPYATLQDMVVADDRRSSGVGAALLAHVEAEARALGCVRLFLESGLRNDRAHHFFERNGFRTTSIVMAKELRGPGHGLGTGEA